jgi:hypothetical protein
MAYSRLNRVLFMLHFPLHLYYTNRDGMQVYVRGRPIIFFYYMRD